MIRTDKLKGIIVKKGFSQSEIAEKIGMSPRTFYGKMKNGVFGSVEIQLMVDILHIEDPTAIFFARK